MGKKKKNRKAIVKRRLKAKQRKEARRKRAGVSERSGGQSLRPPGPDMVLTRPSMAEIEAPEGFRPIGLSQAMVEFARPLLDATEEGAGIDMNEALQIGTATWNYEISLERDGDSGGMQQEIVRQFQQVLGLNLQEAMDRLGQMVARKRFLFPSDIQPDYPMVMFIRKETSHLIPEFDYQALKLQDEPVLPDREDRDMVSGLRGLEGKIEAGVDYGEWEEEFFDLKDLCCERFFYWLQQKGVGEEYSGEFPPCVETYLDFVYGYMHSESMTLQRIPGGELEAFFSDYLLRKVTVEPYEYALWVPALKLFHRFLAEKEYLADAGPAIGLLDRFEPRFLAILRKQFG